MPAPTWPEYLDELERWLAGLEPELDPALPTGAPPDGSGAAGVRATDHGPGGKGATGQGRTGSDGATGHGGTGSWPAPACSPLPARPDGALPGELSARALELLARVEQATVAGEHRRGQLIAALQRLALRGLVPSTARGRVSAEL